MKNEKFFDDSEKQCWDLLEKFNESTHIFDELTKSVKKHHTDGTGYTTTSIGESRYFNIELKKRNIILTDDGHISGCSQSGNEYIDNTIYIESHKVADLLLDAINGLEPLYINFLDDGTTIIFNLSKLTKRPVKTGTMNIQSKGYNKFEIAKRQGLYLKDAAIFDKDYNLVKRAGDEFGV